jgi:hypothetical protein
MPESTISSFRDYEFDYSFETIKAKDNFDQKEKNCSYIVYLEELA